MTSAPHRIALLQRLLHWLMAACIFAMLFIGVGMVSTVTPKYLALILIHKTLGFALLVLVSVRLALRLYYGAPPLPADLPRTMKLGAKLSHQALYALMIAMPLLGLGMLWAAAYPVVLYGGIQIPALLPQSNGMHTLLWNAHVYLGFAFFALALLHLAAGLFHALIRATAYSRRSRHCRCGTRRDQHNENATLPGHCASNLKHSWSAIPHRVARSQNLPTSSNEDTDNDQSRTAKPDRSGIQCQSRHPRRAESAAGRRFRAVSEDQEFPLARVGQPLSRLSPHAGRAVRPDICHD
jgi:cytochrome b561